MPEQPQHSLPSLRPRLESSQLTVLGKHGPEPDAHVMSRVYENGPPAWCPASWFPQGLFSLQCPQRRAPEVSEHT